MAHAVQMDAVPTAQASTPKQGPLLGTVSRAGGTVRVAWKHDALDDVPVEEQLPMQGMICVHQLSTCAALLHACISVHLHRHGQGNKNIHGSKFDRCSRHGQDQTIWMSP